MMYEPWYYINTKGNRSILVKLTDGYYDESRITPEAALMYGMKRCTEFEYLLFLKFGVNLKAPKESRYKWLKVRFNKWLKKLQTAIYALFVKQNTPTQ